MDPRKALLDAEPRSFWLDDPDAAGRAAAAGRVTRRCDLAVVGGGYTGLWTALIAKERDPSLRRRAAGGGTGSGTPPPVATAASAPPA